MSDREVMRFIESCTERFGGVGWRDLANRFPPVEEEAALRQTVNRLLRYGWIRFDETRRYMACSEDRPEKEI